jgi:hypothetical protein
MGGLERRMLIIKISPRKLRNGGNPIFTRRPNTQRMGRILVNPLCPRVKKFRLLDWE